MELTFENASTLFLNYEKNILKFQTFNATKRNFKLHILPYFENKMIKNITIQDFLDWYDKIDSLNYSAHFKNELRTKLVQMYDYLILYFDINDNLPGKLNKFKNFNLKKQTEIKVWTITDCYKFLKVSKKDIVYNTLFEFLIFSGCRIGEALALTFNDINNNKITIDKALSKDYLNGKQILQTTKTDKMRFLKLDFKTKYKLKKLQKYYIKKYGYFNSDFKIFGGIEPLKRTTITRKKDKYCILANVPQIRIHDFRHTHASILYSLTKNVKIVQERLGHSSGSTTINTYIHIFDKENKRTTRALNMLRLIF